MRNRTKQAIMTLPCIDRDRVIIWLLVAESWFLPNQRVMLPCSSVQSSIDDNLNSTCSEQQEHKTKPKVITVRSCKCHKWQEFLK